MSSKTIQPAPLETGRGRQKDDNIDDLGRRPDGSTLDQPVDPNGQQSGREKSSKTDKPERQAR